ncbi:hypothetical protein ISS22_13460 [candidate division KSB1 bacterium]|nr:hypothetical protein [candidate division KSB1 bacterium]
MISSFLKIVICFLLLTNTSVFSQSQKKSWTIKTRIQHGVEYDNNIEESRDFAQSDGLMKLVLNSKLKYFQNKWFVQLNYHGGMQYYFASQFENKFSHDFSGAVSYWQSRRIRIGGNFHTRLKAYSRRNWDYFLTDYETFISFPFSRSELTFYYTLQGLNYLSYDQFDFGVNKFAMAFQTKLGKYNTIRLKGCLQNINFVRYALSYDPQLEEILIKGQKQKDKNSYFSFQWRYQKKWLLSTEYLYQKNRSNSYGFSYQFHRITLSAATHFKMGLLMRLFAGLQRKKYAEALDKLIVTELDSERERSNFVILDFSKDLTGHLSALIRLSYYYNESPIPGRYYRKSLSSFSLEYRF